MLKIDEHLKLRDLPEYIKEQLSYIETFNIRFTVATFAFVAIDLFIILPLLVPMILSYLYILLPPLIFINLWAIWILIRNPYTVQYETILYSGVTGIVGSIVYLMLSHKMAFYFLNIDDLYYYVTVTLFYLMVSASILFYRLLKFKNLSFEALKVWTKEENEKKRQGRPAGLYAIILVNGPGLGYMAAQLIKYSEKSTISIIVFLFMGGAVFCSYIAIKFIHRAIFLKANAHLASPICPAKSDYAEGIVKRDMRIK